MLFNYLSQVLITVLIQLTFIWVRADILIEDFSNHPCRRSCRNSNMVCYYKLRIEKYFSMQPDCLNCTKGNEKDCQNKNCIVADGRSRIVTVYNGMLPGPTIEVCQDDRIVVDINNDLELETTTIHWHGIHHKNSQWMDGVPMVTQDPILPGSTFRYEFVASEPGTTFYHAHSYMQRTNGAYGHLLIKQSKSRNNHDILYDHDLTEHTISLTDWFQEPTENHLLRYLRAKEFYDGTVTTIFINGYGSFNATTVPSKVFHVKSNQRYRFGLIHAGAAACPFKFQIKDHKMLVISSDGFDIRPVEVDSIILQNGERYDFVLKSDQKIEIYQILVTGYLKCEGVKSSALLKYENSLELHHFNNHESNLNELVFNCIYGTYNKCINYKEMKSFREIDPKITKEPDFKYFLTLNLREYARKKYRGVLDSELTTSFINDISYMMPKQTLEKYGSKNEKVCNSENFCGEDLCECLHLITIPLNSLVEMIIVDESDGSSHPMHLHGYSFYVVGEGKIGEMGSTKVVRNMDKNLSRNFDYPIIKDTIVVPEGGYIILRFIADNPGFWLFHCHVDFHMETGMQMIFNVEKF